MLVPVVNRGRAFTVPPVVVTPDAAGGTPETAGEVTAAPFTPEDTAPAGAASTKAESGIPPRVAASPAFSAYGTLNNITRGSSSPPFTRTPSQRASPEVNRSRGRPSGLVPPSCAV